MKLVDSIEKPKKRLMFHFAENRTQLIMWLNFTYLLLCPIYLYSEKEASGNYFPNPVLGFLYLLIWIINSVSFLYNLNIKYQFIKSHISQVTSELIQRLLVYSSLISLMIMSVLNMIGYGNPSSDNLITDFAFAHSLIIITTILINKKAALGWFFIVISILIYVAFVQHNPKDKFDYLTKNESNRFHKALLKKETWAVQRNEILTKSALNSPTVLRLFNIWFVVIIQALICTYFFNGFTNKLLDIIPKVNKDIDDAINYASQEEKLKYHALELNNQLNKQLLEGELNHLKTQINPHFLYNTLNYLYYETSKLDPLIGDYILKFSDLIRFNLIDGDKKEINLDNEIIAINNLIELNQLRFDNGLFIKFTVDIIKKPDEQIHIIPLVLLSIVENALKHGLKEDEANPIIISLKYIESKIIFKTKNKKNYKLPFSSTKIGQNNINRRLKIMYGDNYSIEINDNDDIYEYYLCINLPLRREE